MPPHRDEHPQCSACPVATSPQTAYYPHMASDFVDGRRQPVKTPPNLSYVRECPSATIHDKRVVIRRVDDAVYPAFPFSPPLRYPETARFHWKRDPSNYVYDAVRSILVDLRLDIDRVGLPSWNPLGGFISPGGRALIKPNWVLDTNRNESSSLDSLITDTSLIRAVIDYLIIAVHESGTIEIADAPLQTCDFDNLVRKNMIARLIADYRDQFPRMTFAILDLRKTVLRTRVSLIDGADQQSQQRGDPRGYTMLDLGRDSLLTDIHHRFRRFRVANYDHRLMLEHHNRTRHEYLISNSVLTADFVINMPKLKCHIKAGITGALKNIVGINGHKEYLPHHTNGSPSNRGDQYAHASHIKPVINRIYDHYWTRANKARRGRQVLQQALIKVLKTGAMVLERDGMYDGAWAGNDTIPRTTLDLNHALYFFACSERSLSPSAQRNVLHIVDAVVAGEGYGPLEPSRKPAGVVLGGWNPLFVDLCGARLIGLDYLKVRLLRYGLMHEKSRLAQSCESVEVIDVIDEGTLRSMAEINSLKFRIPKEWQSAAL